MNLTSLRNCYLIITVLIASIACTKTTDPDPLPQNRILVYKVTNLTDTVIYGAVDNIENSITVYIPFYYGLTLIDPQIEVSGGAKIEGEILPVNIEKSTSYTVTGADGSKRIYSLKIVLQNTPPLKVIWATTNLLSYPRAALPIVKGNFWARNRALLKLSMKHQANGKTVTLDPGQGNMQINAADEYSFGGIVVPPDADTGYYQLSIGFMGQQVLVESPVHIIHRQPNVSVLSKVTKQGETITFNSTATSILLNLTAASVTLNGTKYSLPVVSFTPLEMVLKVPDDLPIGDYPTTKFDFVFQGWQPVSKTGSLTVNAK